MRTACILLLLLPLGQVAAASPGRDIDAGSWRWKRVPLAAGGPESGLLAVASHPGEGGLVAVGHGEGVSLRAGRGRFRFVARVTGARDLAFAPDGSLWIASLGGLWYRSPDGRLEERPPAPGELVRAVHRVVVGEGIVVVGTEAGAWASRDGRRWRRLSDGLPTGPATALALSGSGDALWLVVDGELWRFDLESDRARPVAIAGASAGVSPTDLLTGLEGVDVAVLLPRSLAVLRSGQSVFEVMRPAWPPGASGQRLAVGAGGLWLATDLGLLLAPGLAGPWRRADPPAGSAPIRGIAVTARDDEVLVASGLGLLRGSPVLRATGSRTAGSVARAPRRRDPDIRAVHRASLRYLDLGPGRMRGLDEGVAVRGWLPTLSVRIAAARDRSRRFDTDEAYTSGDTRRLNDSQTDRSLDLEASLVMTWDLGALAFDGDAIDVSRERRLIVSLRDNVLDEINQLYFERREVLEQLALAEGGAEVDPRALQRRADELAAGLDAWTGGWFSRPDARPAPGPDESQED